MKRASGLTLVEILVAMALVLLVVSGSLALVARGRGLHRTSESVAQIEEALDAAFGLLVDDVHLAGYLGLAPPGTPPAGASPLGAEESPSLAVTGNCGSSLAHDLATPVTAADGAYQAAAGVPVRCAPGPDGRLQPGADTLVLRHASAEPVPRQSGRLQLETTLRGAILDATSSANLGPDARRHDLEVAVYYVSADSTGRPGWPSLRRKRLVGGTHPAFQDEELVQGISDLQVELGLDAAGDGDLAVERWMAPGETAGAAVRAIRLTLEAISDVREPGLSDARRKRVTRTIDLRNHGALP